MMRVAGQWPLPAGCPALPRPAAASPAGGGAAGARRAGSQPASQPRPSARLTAPHRTARRNGWCEYGGGKDGGQVSGLPGARSGAGPQPAAAPRRLPDWKPGAASSPRRPSGPGRCPPLPGRPVGAAPGNGRQGSALGSPRGAGLRREGGRGLPAQGTRGVSGHGFGSSPECRRVSVRPARPERCFHPAARARCIQTRLGFN